MTRFQRVISYGAMAFAIFLACAIISGIVSTIVGLSFAVDMFTRGVEKLSPSSVQIETLFDEKSVTALDIHLATANLRIETGKTLRVSHNTSDVRVEEQGNTILIEQEDQLFRNGSGLVTLTIPQDFSFSSVEIDAGAGKIQAAPLKTEKLSVSLGAGEAIFDRVSVTDRADIEAGAGKLVVKDGTLGKLDLELGIGKAEIASVLGDGSYVECGVGALILKLLDVAEHYTVSAQTGIGQFIVNGGTLRENTVIGNGANKVTVEGGVGTVDVEVTP